MNTPIIAPDVYRKRIHRMQALAAENSFDVIMIASDEAEPANVRYFTGYAPVFETTAIMIPAKGEAVLLIGPESEALARRSSALSNYRKLLEFRESSDPEYPDIQHSTFEELFSEIGSVRRIGLIGGNVMTVQVYEGIRNAMGNAQIVRCDELLRGMRMIKGVEELDVMRYAAKIAEKSFQQALERIKPGMTEMQVAGECIYSVLSNGAEGTGFPFWCVSGENSNQAIGKPSYRKIERNEIIQISMGAMYEGYTVSYGRPICFGNPSEKAYQLLNTALAANKLTHEILRPGIKAQDIVAKVHGYVRECGFGDYIVYGPCHGSGMMECEYPFVESTSTYTLQPGMTFAVDMFLGGKDFGVRFEDGATITETGVEAFSVPAQELIIL